LYQEEIEMDNEQIAYCGIYCGNCCQLTNVGPEAKKLCESMKKAGYELYGPYIPGFEQFWIFLSDLAAKNGCHGCRKDGGNPYCKVRICAREKNVEICTLCEEYPCKEFDAFFSDYVTLKDDNSFLKEHGIERWLEMQSKRRAEGFTYTDAK
jgi:hypothetical protein